MDHHVVTERRSCSLGRAAALHVVVIGIALVLSATWDFADAQVFTVPRRPGKSRVRYFKFDWMQKGILIGEPMILPRVPSVSHVRTGTAPNVKTSTSAPSASTSTPAIAGPRTSMIGGKWLIPSRSSTSSEGLHLAHGSHAAPIAAGGIRLYFYRQEQNIAERAAASIAQTYRDYVRRFGFVPQKTFPYVLYSSYQEFLQTSLFPVQEGILGVTSTIDLKLALPYFGDYRLFREVSRHEMAHQFTIQQAIEAAERAGGSSGLGAFPLWFVEGVAEYYAKGGIDPEAETIALDLILNADVRRGYGLLGFFEDRPGSVIWTYTLGQVRCGFLEDTYGSGTLQRILDASPRLSTAFGLSNPFADFPSFIAAMVGDDPHTISEKFERWIKRRTLSRYLRAKQSIAEFEILSVEEELIESMNSAPSGNLLAYKTVDLMTGRNELVLFDPRLPRKTKIVARDGVPGTESLHPVAGQSFDLTEDAIAFIAEDSGADILYWREIRHEAEKARLERGAQGAPFGRETWKIELSLGERVPYRLREEGIVAAYSPSFSPDGDRIAFIGLDITGQRDIYILEHAGLNGVDLVRVTLDENAERSIDWGPQGIVFTTDRTSHGLHNIFIVRPERPLEIAPLLDEPRDHKSPLIQSDGTVLFVASEDGRTNVYQAVARKAVQRTDLPTGVYDISPAPDGGIWALYLHGGLRRVIRIPREQFIELDKVDGAGREVTPAEPRARLSLAGAESYQPFRASNWELNNIFAIAGVGGGSVFGRMFAVTSDKLRTHTLVFDLALFGSFDLTDGHITYINEMTRTTWGAGPFQSLRFRLDRTFDSRVPVFFSAERFFGVRGIFRFPFDQFLYTQAEAAIGGSDFVLSRDTEEFLSLFDPDEEGRNLLDVWESRNRGLRLQSEGTLRLGYDTLRYASTGPVAGHSMLLEGTVGVQPFERELFTTARIDAEKYIPISGRFQLMARIGAGSTFGGRLARQFFLSSFDTLRGVEFGDPDFLVGRRFFFSTAELQIPLDAIVALVLFNDIEGIIGADFGGVADAFEGVWRKRVLDFVLGLNLGLGPLLLRLHFARPVDIGAPLPVEEGRWVTNFSLGWVYF